MDDTSLAAAKVSVVVPIFNHASRLPELVDRLLSALRGRYDAIQVLLVDDGSTDDTWATIAALAEHPNVEAVRLWRNFGQTPALCAGFDLADGDVVACCDADFDVYPECLPEIIDAVIEGAPLASAARPRRAFRREMPSRLFNWRTRRMGLQYRDAGSGMFAMSRSLAQEVSAHGEMRRGFRLKVLVSQLAGSVVEIEVGPGDRSSSHHRLSELASAWFEAELALRRSAYLGLVAFGGTIAVLALFGTIALGASAAWHTSTRQAGFALGLLIVALLGVAIGAMGAIANQIIRSQLHPTGPFNRVAEHIGAETRDAPPS